MAAPAADLHPHSPWPPRPSPTPRVSPFRLGLGRSTRAPFSPPPLASQGHPSSSSPPHTRALLRLTRAPRLLPLRKPPHLLSSRPPLAPLSTLPYPLQTDPLGPKPDPLGPPTRLGHQSSADRLRLSATPFSPPSLTHSNPTR